jgi:DNA-binding transcriptional LysR family regulator
VLVRRADAVFAEVESLRAELAEHSRGLRGELRIGAFPTAIAHIVAPAARALRAAAPGVRLEVVEAEGEDAFARLTRQELDIVVSIEAPGAPPRDDPRTVRTALGADRMRAVLSEEHPLARCSEVALEELAGEDWVVPPVGWLCERVILAGCQTAGFTPRVVHRAGDWSAIVALCGAGMGVGMVPQLAGALDIPGAVVLAVAEPAPRRHIFAACRRGAEDAPAVRAVLDAMGAVALGAPDALAAA